LPLPTPSGSFVVIRIRSFALTPFFCPYNLEAIKSLELKLELDLELYQRGILAMNPARWMAWTSKRDFLEELGKRKIVRHYTMAELEEDVAFAKGRQYTSCSLISIRSYLIRVHSRDPDGILCYHDEAAG
jgi:predicted HTH domain antitoxin